MKNSLKIWEALVHSVLVKARLCSEIKNFIAYEPHMVQLCKYFSTNTKYYGVGSFANNCQHYLGMCAIVLLFMQLYNIASGQPNRKWQNFGVSARIKFVILENCAIDPYIVPVKGLPQIRVRPTSDFFTELRF